VAALAGDPRLPFERVIGFEVDVATGRAREVVSTSGEADRDADRGA
jgi:hypothetical protein